MEKHYDFLLNEKAMQELWSKHQIYKYDAKSARELYSIDTPPPTISGSLHIGHIFSYTQAEMIARFKRMQGYNVFYPFGFDDNGLPTERLVEKEENIIAMDLPRSEFIEKCIQTTKKYEDEFKTLWQSLGFSVDWSLQYETINPLSQCISQRSFIDLYKKGKAYMKDSPVLWCTECQTSIAQAELETIEKETQFITLIFKSESEALHIATTRPELLYGTVCLFVNPNDSRYKHLHGKSALVPLYDYEIPILTDEKVAPEKGTGIVMCATYGDITDLEWSLTYKLPYRQVILANGHIESSVPLIGGQYVTNARKTIIDLLDERGLLIKREQMTHHVATHERCGKAVEIIPSRQWYIDILTDQKKYIEAADEINWYPPHMKNRYLNWVENLKWDWCISRQRYFGVPFPVWYCDQCHSVIIAEDHKLPINPLETMPSHPCTCGSTSFTPESAVLDTWATSSVTPQINGKWGEPDDASEYMMPMSMRTQAHEIIRTWAFYTIVKSLHHTGKLPWKDIMICGFVLAKKGEKISKSKDNAIQSPPELIKTHSADAIRYWAATAKLGTDTFFSPDELGQAKRFLNKLWNASKFTLSHLEDYDPKAEMKLLPADFWIIERCKETMISAQKALEKYEIGLARHEMDILFWRDFCDYYLEIAKERLYQPEKHGMLERRGAQHALYISLLMLLKLYAIYVPHITESIYQLFFTKFEPKLSIHQLKWCKINTLDDQYLFFGDLLKEEIATIRKYKSENGLSMKAEVEEMNITCVAELQSLFIDSKLDITSCCHAKKLIVNKRNIRL